MTNRKLGFGLMRLPLTEEGNPKSIDQVLVNSMVDKFLEEGFTYFDTGYPYHHGLSEGAAKKALVERYQRQAFTLTDKMPTFLVTSPDDYPRIFSEQLERCGVSYFDCYLLHSLGEKNYRSTLRHGGFEFMKQLQEEGRAKHIGFSYHDNAALLDEILTDHPEMEYVQLQLNYIDWDSDSIESGKCYEVAQKHGKAVIVMEPLKGGALASVPGEAQRLFDASGSGSAASFALRYAASLEGVMVVLSGMSDAGQVYENCAVMKEFKPLSDAERQLVGKAAKIIAGSTAIACTGCRYCTDGCPQKIAIPEYFSLFNNQYRFGCLPAHHVYYENLLEKNGRAATCIACGQCERHCPQHLPITALLKEVSAVFDE